MTRELTVREKQAIWMQKKKNNKEKGKSIKNQGLGEIKSFETTGDISNQQRPGVRFPKASLANYGR